VKFSPLIHLPQFIIGIITGVVFIRRQGRDASAMGIASIGSFAAIATVLAFGNRIPYLLLQAGLLAPLFAVAVYTLAHGRGIVCRVLSHGAAVKLGEASYALYLLHMPLSWYMTRVLTLLGWPRIEAWTGLTGFVAIALTVSLAVNTAVEEPARLRLRQWYRSAEGYPWGRFRLRSVLNPSG
jgi:peptidoglycan/LPS O-acetylase OafA/YrhL